MGTKKKSSKTSGNKGPSRLASIKNSSIARQSVFGFFWGLGHFVDAFRQPSVFATANLESITHVVVIGLAVWLMMRPSSTTRIGFLALANIVEAVSAMPIMPNHKMIFFMADSAIVVSIAVFAFSNRRELTDWFTRSEPFLRLALFVTYGSATIAKLNSGWFNTELSCAAIMPAREFAFLNDFLGFEIPWTSFWFMPFVIVGCELLIWLTVLFPRLRPYGLVLAVLFHLSLSLTPVSQGLGFSYLLFPLLILYLSDDSHKFIYQKGKSFIALLERKNLLIIGGYLVIGLAVFLGYISVLSPRAEDREVQAVIRYVPALIILFAIGLVIVFFALRDRSKEQVKPAIGVPSVIHWILVILVALNSLAPYVGLKTYATMTMYSNIQMENGKSNHLLIPRIPVDTLVDDEIDVLASSNSELVALYNSGYKLNWHELQRRMSEDPAASIVFVRNGETFDLTHAYELPELVETNALHKLLGFRFITEQPVCIW